MIFIVKANEDSKTINNVIPLIEEMIDAGFKSNLKLLQLGEV